MASIGGFGGSIEDLGNAVGSLFTAKGNAAEANSYTSAGQLEEQNAQLTAASTRIQATQEARTVAQSIGTTQSDVASAGFTQSGSALDILKSSQQQGSLAKSLINIQGAINENAYAAEAGADYAKGKAANEANTAGTISAIASIGGALVSGGSQLASAGKTVSSVYNTVSGWFGGGSATGATTTNLGDIGSELDGSFLPPDFSLSLTDTAIGHGAGISDYLSSASIGADTSGFSLGTSVGAVSDAISSVYDSISSGAMDAFTSAFGADAASMLGADFIPGLNIALLADMIPGVSDIPVVGDVLDGISNVVGGITDGVVNAVSDVGSAIGDAFGSVICTALYKRGMLSRAVWNGAQKYGRDFAAPHMYAAYLAWGTPVAKAIMASGFFAHLIAPFFVPWAHVMAEATGEKTAKSNLLGKIVFGATYAFTFVLGNIFYKRSRYAIEA